MADTDAETQPPRCPTCGSRESEDAGQDVRRCANCGYLWIVPPSGQG